ncbi:MAG: hypothetical protein ACE37K_15570 [Planctomycetota bacterium]
MIELLQENPYRQLHESVRKILGKVSDMLRAAHRDGWDQQGFLCFDFAHPDADPEFFTVDAVRQQWRGDFIELSSEVEKANELWGRHSDDCSATVGQAFTAASPQAVECGPLARSSYHELGLALGRIAVGHLKPNVILDDELIGLDGFKRDTRKNRAGATRLNIFKVLADHKLLQRLRCGAEREGAGVLRMMPNTTGRTNGSTSPNHGHRAAHDDWLPPQSVKSLRLVRSRIGHLNRRRTAQSLIELARSLEKDTDSLRRAPSWQIVESMRTQLSEAGGLLLRLLAFGAVPMPNKPPTWLGWWTAPHPRPRFTAFRSATERLGAWPEKVGFARLAYKLDVHEHPARQEVIMSRPHGSFLRRLIFLEAASSWLGRMTGTASEIMLPDVSVRAQSTEPGSAEGSSQWIEATSDRAETAEHEHTLFLQIGRLGTRMCTFLASITAAPIDEQLLQGQSGVKDTQRLLESGARREPAAPEPEADDQVNEPHAPQAAAAERAEDGANATMLHGWPEILPALGFEAKNRNDREKVKKLNEQLGGPITKRGMRKVMANEGRLLAWWCNLEKRARERADQDCQKARQDRAVDAAMSNPGVRREAGFHDRTSPNQPGRR